MRQAINGAQSSRLWLFTGLMALFFALAGCQSAAVGTGGKFRIKGHNSTEGDRVFIISEFNRLTEKPYSVKLKNNAVGVYADPAVIGNSWYLMVSNVVAQGEDASKKQLNGFVRLAVRTDEGEFSIEPSEADYSQDRTLENASRESATFQLSEVQLVHMINARNLEVFIVGSSNNIAVTSENMYPGFQFQLSEFYRLAKSRQKQAAG